MSYFVKWALAAACLGHLAANGRGFAFVPVVYSRGK